MSLSGLAAGVTAFRPSRNASRLEEERGAVCDELCDEPFEAFGFSTLQVGLGYSVALSTAASQPSKATKTSRVDCNIHFACRSNIFSPSQGGSPQRLAS